MRRVPASLLASERWSRRVRIDCRGNALFPHFDQDGLCGIEIKNEGFTGFSKAGTKGLFSAVGKKDDDQQLVIAETAIDLASHAALFPNDHSRYVSTAGSLNKTQPALLNRAMANMPQDSRIVLAVDNDPGGDKLIAAIEPIFKHVQEVLGRGDLEWIIHRPEILNDWNDELRATPPLPYRRRGCSAALRVFTVRETPQ